MPEQQDPIIEQLLTEQRHDNALREASLGPIAAAAAMVRESCDTTCILLNDLETSVAFHLEILDALLRRRFGNSWWDELTQDGSEEVH